MVNKEVLKELGFRKTVSFDVEESWVFSDAFYVHFDDTFVPTYDCQINGNTSTTKEFFSAYSLYRFKEGFENGYNSKERRLVV